MSNEKLDPMDGRVVVRQVQDPDKSPGGILIPETAKKIPTRGTVLAVGRGRMLETGVRMELALKVGDVVVFPKYAGAEIDIEGVKLKILEDREILARVVAE